MARLLNSLLFALSLLLANGSQISFAKPEGNRTSADNGSVNSRQEMMNRYESSIKYWDTNNSEIRKSILKELTIPEEFKVPGCPRIRYPLVCDSDGSILENSCYFRMRRRERSNILPIMVFTSTPIDAARNMCENETKTNPKPNRPYP